jgi:hypothetical protein
MASDRTRFRNPLMWVHPGNEGGYLHSPLSSSITKIKFPLVSDAQYANLTSLRDKSAKRHIACLAEGNHQFPQALIHSTTNERVVGKQLDSLDDGGGSSRCCSGVFVDQKLECALDVDQRPFAVDYLRDGFGRAGFLPAARAFIHA